MHITILIGNYYPNYSAVGNCAKNFSEALERMGHDVTIVSQRTSLAEEKQIERPQSIYRIDTFFLRCILRGQEKGRLSSLVGLFVRTVRYAQSILQRRNVKWDIVKAYIRELNLVEQHKPIDVIVPFCFPFEGVLAAATFRQQGKHTVNVVPFLFDRFAASDALHRTKWNGKRKMAAHIRLEKRAFSRCNRVLMMPSWKKHVHQFYPELEHKFVEVEHPLLVPINSQKHVDYDSTRLNIVFTGSLLKIIHSPLNSFHSLAVTINERPEICVHLYARGNCEDDIREFMRQCPEQVVYHGSVDIETAHAAMKAADILLSVGNSNITQMASKNFEYVATGSPVIHFYCDKNDPVNALLAKMGNCLMLSQHDTPEQNGKSIIRYLESQPVKHSFQEVAEIIPEALPETTAKILIDTLSDKSKFQNL